MVKEVDKEEVEEVKVKVKEAKEVDKEEVEEVKVKIKEAKNEFKHYLCIYLCSTYSQIYSIKITNNFQKYKL